MRTWLIATAGVALMAGSGADAQQRVVAHGPMGMRPGANFNMPAQSMAQSQSMAQARSMAQALSMARAQSMGQGQSISRAQSMSQAQASQQGGIQTWQVPSRGPGQGNWQHGGGYNNGGYNNGGQHMQPGQPAHVPAPPMAWGNSGGRPPMVHAGQSRWGSKVGGRWWGGANAPGGWNAYHRPYRGYSLPSYWIAPRFYISDWQSYGLTQPTYGYNWVRYYDDAVLVDGRGSVYDTRAGIDWDRYDEGYYAGDDRVYADGGYDDRGYEDRGHDDRRYDERGYQRRDDGVGGAVVGAVVGGVAGNVIAGQGNRLGGTLIGAGVGAAAGYAIDKAEDRGPPPPPAYRGRDRAVPMAPDRAPPPPPAGYGRGGDGWRSADGTTTVTTSNGAAGYYSNGYYYPGTSTTTVVVQTAPVVTTTTTEIYEDAVTYTRRPVVHARTKTKRVWRPAPKCLCR